MSADKTEGLDFIFTVTVYDFIFHLDFKNRTRFLQDWTITTAVVEVHNRIIQVILTH